MLNLTLLKIRYGALKFFTALYNKKRVFDASHRHLYLDQHQSFNNSTRMFLTQNSPALVTKGLKLFMQLNFGTRVTAPKKMPQDEGNPAAIALEINAQSARRAFSADVEHVRSYTVTPEMIQEAHAVTEADAPIPQFWIEKYERNVARNWDLFYKRNTENFFKDRMWIRKEFSELSTTYDSGLPDVELVDMIGSLKNEQRRLLLVEIGCGVGNALFSILRENAQLDAVGIDCSSRAIQFLNARWERLSSVENSSCTDPDDSQSAGVVSSSSFKNSDNEQQKSTSWTGGRLLNSGVFDILSGPIPETFCVGGSADFVLLMFVLSALPPSSFVNVAHRVRRCLRPGGMLLFRDYGRYDMTQLRFASSKRAQVRKNFYVRQDGTLAYYFTCEEVRRLFVTECGLEELENTYFLREIVNRKLGKSMKRIWIQAKFRCPLKT